MTPHKRARNSSPAALQSLSPSRCNVKNSPDLTKDKAHKGQDAADATISEDPYTSTDHSIQDDDRKRSKITEKFDDIDDGISQQSSTTPQKARSHLSGEGGYNALKSFNGQYYSGMAVGGSHTWNYDQGVWKETKEEPDLWKIDYETVKRRAKNAPQGSGAAVGTEYHWLIVAHQYVKKTDANTYETHLVGSKYKLAHKAGASNSWSVPTVKAQREREVELLDDAKRRVQGLPPVLAGEKVKVEKRERGQQKLDALFSKVESPEGKKLGGVKRKAEVINDGE